MEYLPLIKKKLKLLKDMGVTLGGKIPELSKFSENDKIFYYLKYHNYTLKTKSDMLTFLANLTDFIYGIKVYDFISKYLNIPHSEIVFKYESEPLWNWNSNPETKFCSCYWFYSADSTGKICINFIDIIHYPDNMRYNERIKYRAEYAHPDKFDFPYLNYFKKFLDVYNIDSAVFAANCLATDNQLLQLDYSSFANRHSSTTDDPMLCLKDIIYARHISVFKLAYQGQHVLVCLTCSSSREAVSSITSCSLSELDGTRISIFDERMPKLLDKLSLLGGL